MKPQFAITFLLIVFACTRLYSQGKEIFLTLDPVLAQVANREFYIDSVADERDAASIGFLRLRREEDSTSFRFATPFQEVLTTYFKQVVPVGPGQERIIALVSEFNVSGKKVGSEFLYSARVKIAFCRLDSGRLFNLSEYTGRDKGLDKDAINGPALRLVAAINSCLEQFGKSGFRYNTGSKFQGLADWMAKTPENDILRCKYRKRGTYPNFASLRSNTPIEMKIDIEPAKRRFNAKETDTGKEIKDVFGICNGSEIYINSRLYANYNVRDRSKGIFAHVLEVGRYVIWEDRYVSLGEFAVASLLFGQVLGPMLAGAKADLIVLDMKTEKIIPINMTSIRTLLAEDPDVLARYDKAVNKTLQPVMMAFLKDFNKRNPL